MVYRPRLQPWARIAASSAHTSSTSGCFSPGRRKWALNRRSFSTSMSRSARRMGAATRIKPVTQFGEVRRLFGIQLLGMVGP